MQLLIIGVFTCFMLASATTNKASQKRVDASNAAANVLRSYGYENYCMCNDRSIGISSWGFKKGNCKATIRSHFGGNDRNSQVTVVFQYCEASSSIKNELSRIANCTYHYDNSDYVYCDGSSTYYDCRSGKGVVSPNSSGSSSSSKDCSLNHWVERRGNSYVPYFQKSGNCGLSIDYSIYSVSTDRLLYSGHLYFTKSEYGSPSTGYSYNESIRIVITSKKWD